MLDKVLPKQNVFSTEYLIPVVVVVVIFFFILFTLQNLDSKSKK